MKAQRSIKNLASALILQLVTIVLGFVIPRITLNNYGSEINGFMSLVTQIYSYVALLEAGLATTAIQALYGSIAKKDNEETCGIINATKIYYNKVAIYYTGIVAIITVVLPFVLSSQMSKVDMAAYFLLFGVSNIINFLFTAAKRPLLVAEGKNYVNNNIATIFHLILQFVKTGLLMIKVNLVALQAVYSAINVIQIVVYFIYFKRNYKWLDSKVKPRLDKLAQRGAFFVQQFNNLVFSCVDVVVISFFCDLKVASVYTVYMLIYNALSILMTHFSSSTQFILGQTYNENREKYLRVHRTYETATVSIGCVLFTTASILTIPFIKIYTAGITDINYVDLLLPVMLSLNGILSTFKSTSTCLVNFSYHAKQTMARSIFESGINLVLTLALVPFLGIRGALIGTGVALVYRVVDLLFYANHRILNTSIKKPLFLYLGCLILFFGLTALGYMANIQIEGYLGFLVAGIIVFIIAFVIFLLFALLCERKQAKQLVSMLLAKIKKK